MPYADRNRQLAYLRNYRAAKKQIVATRRYEIAPEAKLLHGVVRPLPIRGGAHGLRIAVIPDVQAVDGAPVEHLRCAGLYLAEKRPDVIVCLGDFGDFPSLSRFDRGTRLFEGRRYVKDLAAFHHAMDALMTPLVRAPKYRPHLEFLLGNHEDHIVRATVENAALEGLLSLDDLRLAEYGWRVHPFLQPVAIGGVAFCHYFPAGPMGRPITTAQALLRKLHMSAVAGHQQGRDIAYSRRADGSHLTAIISGSFYEHDMEYLSPFTNQHWRGMYMLHEVRDGRFDEMALSVEYLKRRFARRKR